MNAIAPIVNRHSRVAFFVLAYGLSWGNSAVSTTWPNFPFLFPYGPLLAALIVAGVTGGRDGLKDLLSRCLRWRVGLKWYAAALFVPVALALAAVALNILLGARMLAAAQLGPWYSLFLLFPVAMLDAPLGEETGWRGYALPRFPARRSPLANSVILGVLLAGWHLPLALAAGPVAVPYLAGTIASAVLTNWVYYSARESALLAIVFHTAQNTIGGWYLFPTFSGPDLVRLWWLWAVMYAVVAGLVALAAGPTLGRQSGAEPAQVVMQT